MTKLKEMNKEVFYVKDSIVKIKRDDIKSLKKKAVANPRKKARICTHKDVNDPLHEMIIVHAKGAYVRPHKHRRKSESFHVIEGLLRVIIFDNKGNVSASIDMGGYGTGKVFYYRLSKERFHTVIIISDIAVFHETTNGPFDRRDMICAPWAPRDDEPVNSAFYLTNLIKRSRSTYRRSKKR